MSSTATVPVLVIALCCASISQVNASDANSDFSAAASQYAAQHWEQAASGFRQFAEQYPDSPKRGEAMLLTGEALVQERHFAEAYSLLVDLMAEQPNGPIAKQALFRAGEAAIGCGKLDEAQIRLSQFQWKYPDDKLNANVLIDQAKLALHVDDVATAEKFYRQSLSRFGDSPTADECRLGLAHVLQMQKQPEAADQLLHELAQGTHSPFTETALLQLAAEQLDAHHPQAALDLYATIEKRFPASPLIVQTNLGCGQALCQLGRFTEAVGVLRPLAKNTQVGADAHRVLLMAQKGESQEKQRLATEMEQKRIAQEKERLRLALEERHRQDQAEQDRIAKEEQQRNTAQQQQEQLTREAAHRNALAAQQPAAPAISSKPAVSIENPFSTGLSSIVSSRRDTKASVIASPTVTAAPTIRTEPAPAGIDASIIESAPSPASKISSAPVVEGQELSREEQDRRRSAQIRFEAADAMIHSGDFTRAIATLQMGDSAGDDPRSMGNRYLLSIAQQKAGREAESLETLNQLSAVLQAKLAVDSTEPSASSSVSPQDRAAFRSLNDTVQLARVTDLVAKEKYAAAIEPLQIFLATAEHDARAEQALATLAICLVHADRLDDSQCALAELQKQFPHSKLLASTTAQIADAAYDAGQFAAAAELFARLTVDGNSPQAVAKGLAGVGWCRFQTGEFEAANVAMSQFLDRFPTDGAAAETVLMRGQTLEHLKKDDQAAVVYRQALQRYPQTKQMPQLILAAARLYDRIGQDSEAVPLYERVIQEYPKSPDIDAVQYDLAWSLRDLGRQDESDKVFQKLCEEHPQSRYYGDATYRLAERASQHGHNDAARAMLAPLLANQGCPSEVREHALYLLAQMAIGEEKWAMAQPFLEQLARDFPDGKLRVPADFWLAEAAFRSGDYATAQQRFDAVAPHVADHSQPWMAIVPLRRAQILAGQKQWSAARTMAETVAQDYPHFDRLFEADYVIGRALVAEEKLDDARSAFQRVVQSASGGKTETAAMAQSKIADTYFQQENYAAAVREYLRVDTAYAFPHWQAAALLQAARCYEKLGQEKDAGELYARVLQNYPQTEFVAEASRRLMDTTKR